MAIKAERGVVYMIWGNDARHERALERSIESLKAVHPELPTEVVRLGHEFAAKGLANKAGLFRNSPFRETLFLDLDTVVLRRLDYGFERARRFGLACVINECPWANRHTGLSAAGDLIEYNTGVLFFTERARPVFEAWERLVDTVDGSLTHMRPGDMVVQFPFSDQAAFAAAIEECRFNPFCLPMNWNFRPEFYFSFFGPVVIWHDYRDIPPEIQKITDYYNAPGALIRFFGAR